ncbi:hypothetical protein GF359_02790 [candidate division WOR-3 bacterium]|uniref:Uncharacterized protein n=1 Tax=candidate division WOR-3 bacterium TaxID=2052148 RepID=A0A9D5K9J5_UNCW3|nr:hypothetical protein [candidate division WOR-3 bacterium]MBD3364120.1 hypothetical protein [candidate division WOR-3 bacterium]
MENSEETKELRKVLKAMGYKVRSVDEGASGVVVTVSTDENHPPSIN